MLVLLYLLTAACSLVVTQWEMVTVYIIPTVSVVTRTTSTSNRPTEISTSKETPTSNDSRAFALEMLHSHNVRRAQHHAQPLVWNNSLYEFASEYVANYDCSGNLKHSGGPYGENLAIGYSPTGAIDAWYSEGNSYNYEVANTYDHFTQVVWNDTTQLGCASKYCNPVWNDYIVCSYYPAGNVIGHNQDNVFPI